MSIHMAISTSIDEGGEGDKASAYVPIFTSITHKQHEVFRLVVQNRTSKEIAGALGISESAVNQRIEAVRGRAGFPPRAELARAYRRYLAVASGEGQVLSPQSGPAEGRASADQLSRAPGLVGQGERVVPRLFRGRTQP
jgi:DNA-binding CsgD family transcriptional regulator